MPSFQYSHPKLYDLAIRITQNKKILTEFNKQVGKNNSVFDIAAGYGRMSRYIDSSNSYSGIDLNEISLEYAEKHGYKVSKGNIFDPKAYTKNDVLILVDVVHHIKPEKLTELFDLVFLNAKKRVIILEPSFVNLEKKYGIVGKYIDKALMKLDNDGINTIEKWFTELEYEDLLTNKFNSKYGKDFDVKVQRITPYYIVTYRKP
jgi:SAM-dependent methyltransferase